MYWRSQCQCQAPQHAPTRTQASQAQPEPHIELFILVQYVCRKVHVSVDYITQLYYPLIFIPVLIYRNQITWPRHIHLHYTIPPCSIHLNVNKLHLLQSTLRMSSLSIVAQPSIELAFTILYNVTVLIFLESLTAQSRQRNLKFIKCKLKHCFRNECAFVSVVISDVFGFLSMT